MSLCAIGIPSSLPRVVPTIIRDSAARASARARSSVTVMKLCSVGSKRQIRTRQCRVNSTGESLRDEIRADACEMVMNSSISGLFGFEDMGSFGFARQRRSAIACEHIFDITPRAVEFGYLGVSKEQARAPHRCSEVRKCRVSHIFLRANAYRLDQ